VECRRSIRAIHAEQPPRARPGPGAGRRRLQRRLPGRRRGGRPAGTGWTIQFEPTGAVSSLSRELDELVQPAAGDNLLHVGYDGGTMVACDAPFSSSVTGTEASFSYDLSATLPLTVQYDLRLALFDGLAALERKVTLTPTGALAGDVRVTLGNNLGFSARRSSSSTTGPTSATNGPRRPATAGSGRSTAGRPTPRAAGRCRCRS